MYGLSEQEIYSFTERVVFLANRAEGGKDSPLECLLELREEAVAILAKHKKAVDDEYAAFGTGKAGE